MAQCASSSFSECYSPPALISSKPIGIGYGIFITKTSDGNTIGSGALGLVEYARDADPVPQREPGDQSSSSFSQLMRFSKILYVKTIKSHKSTIIAENEDPPPGGDKIEP